MTDPTATDERRPPTGADGRPETNRLGEPDNPQAVGSFLPGHDGGRLR